MFKLPLFNPGYNFETGEDLNKRNREYRELEDMYHIIENDFYPEIISEIDTSKNIIIITPNEYNFIKRNEFGKLDILATTDIELSSCRAIKDGMIKIINFIPKIKLIVPKGIEVTFTSPVENNYTEKIYCKNDIETRKHYKSRINDFLIYTRLDLDLYIDLHQMKRYKPILKIDFGQPLFSIGFNPIYYIGHPKVEKIEDIYWLKNDNLMQQCEDIF